MAMRSRPTRPWHARVVVRQLGDIDDGEVGAAERGLRRLRGVLWQRRAGVQGKRQPLRLRTGAARAVNQGERQADWEFTQH